MPMSEIITWEWRFLAISMMWGMALSVLYDILRIFRRVVIHRKVYVMAAEDILFWMFCGFFIFHVTFMVNDGIVRAFSVIGFVLGSLMYQYTLSPYFVKYSAKAIRFVLKPLKKLFKYIRIRLSISKRDGKRKYEKIRNKAKSRVKGKKKKTL